MMHNIQRGLLALLLWLPCVAAAQSGEEGFWQDYMELWAEHYEQEQMPDEWMETLQELREMPVNLNDTTRGRLLQLPFVSPQQAAALKAYIEQTGLLFSLSELPLVNGFDSATCRLLAPFVVVQPLAQPPPRLREMLTQGHHSVVMGTGRTVERAAGYGDSSFLGDPFRYYLRYSYKYKDYLHFQLSADQDAGEGFAWNEHQHGFDFYGFHLIVRNMGRLKSAVVGRYQLQFGQGLTLWSGFAPWNDFGGATWRYGQGIRPASAFCEYGMLQGAAATVAATRHIDVTAFYSYADRDATLRTDTAADGLPLIRSIYSSGYHRTATEVDKKAQLTEQLYGANLHYQREQLSVGVTACRVTYSREIRPYPYPYNYFAFSGKENFNAGADVSWRVQRCLLFGEVAFSQNGGAAQLAGMQFSPNNDNHLSLLWRHYDKDYQNRYATAFGQSGSVQNESGFFLTFSTVLPGRVSAAASVDFFRWPGLRYQLYAPSVGEEYRLRLSRELGRRNSVTLQYRYKSRDKNVYDAQIYEVEQTVRHQWQALWRCRLNDSWSFATRAAYAGFRGVRDNGTNVEDNGAMVQDKVQAATPSSKYHGIMLLQDVSCTFPLWQRPLRLSLRAAVFNVEDYDARLYAMDNGFIYETSTVAYYGKGVRASCLFRYDVSRSVAFCIKYSIVYYPDKESIGSGHAEIEGNRRQEWKAQLRMAF